jgi:uncharacterized protein YcnI
MTKRIVLAALAAAVLAPAASAHVTANPSEAPAGGFAMISFRVPHGCEESPTTSISVQIPPGVVSVAPEAVPGWEVETVEGPYDEPVLLHGEEVTEGVKEVTWTGGPLDAHQFLDFGLSMRMPETEGETVYFPVVQTCEQGETGWITIPVEGEEEPDTPAPGVELLAASGGHGSSSGSSGSDDQTSSDAEEPATEGDAEAAAAVEAEDDDDGMVMAAMVMGGLGLVAGLGALGLTWRRGRTA